jgi:hypothetical protein
MPTHYKPSQWRGKRLVHQSTDPDEPRREAKKAVVLIALVIIMMGLFCIQILMGFY